MHAATNFPDFDGLLGYPAIGKYFVGLLSRPKLFATGKPGWK
jgi:hypothetical protein